MTLVFNTQKSGSLTQIQVGSADVVATVAAANSAWGWMGGLVGVKEILKACRQFSTGKKEAKSFGDPKLSHLSCQILTYDGIANIHNEDATEAFGGESEAQMLGLTICAFAYVLKKHQAVDLFMVYLAPSLLPWEVSSANGLREALHTQLNDNIDAIVNEGAARGLSDRFYRANSALGLAEPHLYGPRYEGWGQSRGQWPAESSILGGFLKWLGSGAVGQYQTRSAGVARLAACLEEIGYKIAEIKVWNGMGVRPTFPGLLLVIGGPSETDPLMEEESLVAADFVYVSHYYYATTGSMLLNSLQTKCDIPPEVFQQCFEDVDAAIHKQLTFKWKYPAGAKELHACPEWTCPDLSVSRIAVRLAAFYFPQSAEIIAQFYERIANEKVLSSAKEKYNVKSLDQDVGQSLIRFRVYYSFSRSCHNRSHRR